MTPWQDLSDDELRARLENAMPSDRGHAAAGVLVAYRDHDEAVETIDRILGGNE